MRILTRRYHHAGIVLRRRADGRQRRLTRGEWVRLRGGNLVRSLTPRQAVIWLLNLDAIMDRLPESIRPHFSSADRSRLARALRARVASREGLVRHKRSS